MDLLIQALSGKMFLYAAGSALVAAPVAIALLHLFKRSVVKGMRVQSAPEDASGEMPVEPTWRETAPRPTLAAADRSLLGVLAVYAAGGVAVAAIFTAVMSIQAGTAQILQLMFWFGQYIVPIFFAGWIVLPKGPGRTLFVAGWFAAWLVLSGVPLAMAGTGTLGDVLLVLLFPALPAALLIAVFMSRGLRAAGPLVLIIVTGSVVGWNLIFDSAQASPAVFGSLAAVATVVGMQLLYFGVFVVGSLVGVAVTWPLLRGVGYLHGKKVISDQLLTMDVVVLWFCAFFAMEAATEAPAWVLSALVAFIAYKAVTLLGFGVLSLARKQQPHADLVLLRPFWLGVRSQRLFDQLSKVWLRIGSIHMIAGPDLVKATVAPSEFLAFLSGRLSRAFINDRAELRERLAALDLEPDPDGRFRINQLFCRDNIWRDTMRSLTRTGRVVLVLMDLRGFTQSNQGCAFEIGELLRSVPLERVVFAVDGSTDHDYLNWVVQQVWSTLTADSPNLGVADLTPHVIWLEDTASGRRNLLGRLMESAATA